jgi:predicted nucleic acid-binding protein
LLEAPELALWAPDLLLLEVANVLAKRVTADAGFDDEGLRLSMGVVIALGISYVPAHELIETLLPFVPSLTPYDATYLAAALELGAPIATFDRKLAAVCVVAGLEVWPDAGYEDQPG